MEGSWFKRESGGQGRGSSNGLHKRPHAIQASHSHKKRRAGKIRRILANSSGTLADDATTQLKTGAAARLKDAKNGG